MNLNEKVILVVGGAAGIGAAAAVLCAQRGATEGVARVLAWLCSDDAEYVRGMVSTR